MALRFLILLFFFLFNQTCRAQIDQCPPSSCGKFHNISYPFRLNSDPKDCGDEKYALSCENNITILYLYSGKYLVEAINYNNHTIRIIDPTIQKNSCSSVPQYSLTKYNFSFPDPYDLRWRNTEIMELVHLTKSVIFVSSENPVKSHLYLDTASCFNGSSGSGSSSNSALTQSKRHYYVTLKGSLSVSDMVESCRVELMAMVSGMGKNESNVSSFMEIHNELANGIELSWEKGRWRDLQPAKKGPWEKIMDKLRNNRDAIKTLRYFTLVLIGMLAAKTVLGTPFVIIFLIYKWRRRHLSMYHKIEEFLQSYNNLIPIRYSYLDVKKMAKGFEDKLGEGGYGSVYKGKLRSGRLVAIKMLGQSKGDGQDFINEVATIGRIHHVNVVQLIGFCVEGSKRALVYDFMPNGSLDTHIFSNEGIDSLTCKKMFEISLGVARGIEYLHRGCEMQILHFDIKPHNILLDENFVPKVSDFGLARLCPLDNNIVSLTAARGTLGYIAPELFYKNIGGVSYKADVYSFGMLLMEMASRRKNVNHAAGNSSQVHFPSWVSNQFNEGRDIDFGVTTDEESKIIKKMMVVALWCIQFKPCDRPSMSKVVEMLEEKTDHIEMPPTKFTFYLQEEPVESVGEYSSRSTWSSTQSDDDYTDSGLKQNSN